MRKKYFYHYGNGSSSKRDANFEFENPHLSKCSSNFQTQSHGTCDSIGIQGLLFVSAVLWICQALSGQSIKNSRAYIRAQVFVQCSYA